jgi:hypothetical protein
MWTFDVCEINSEMMVSDTLCDLLSRRIDRLDMAMQKVLEDCISYRLFLPRQVFCINISSLELLDMQTATFRAATSRHTTTLVQSVLSRASSEGFIEMIRR